MDIEKKEIRGRSIHIDVPVDIMEAEIVSRLPVKSVLRLRCVSKSWRRSIDSEYFTRRHYQHSIRNRERGMVIYKDGKNGEGRLKKCSVQALLTGRAAAASRDVRLGGKDWWIVSVDGDCNGLVLLKNSRMRFVLWNPWTGISKQLRKPGRNVHRRYCLAVLGWDESSGEYMACAFKFHRESGLYICSVYRSKRNSWKTLEEKRCLKYIGGEGQFANGTAHWKRSWNEWSSKAKAPGIVSFDMKREVFGEMELPFERDSDYNSSCLGRALGGCLCVIVISVRRCVSVWVWMEHGVKESWVETINKVPYQWATCGVAPPVPDGEIICTTETGFLLYDPTLDVIKYFTNARICHQTLLNPYRLR